MSNVYALHLQLAAQILKVLGDLAQNVPNLAPDQVHTATLDNLQQLLPHEHKVDFNEDMSQCIYMSGIHQFSLSAEAVATNILPHYATFLSSMIIGNLINYRKQGCPVSLKIELDSNGLATATIQWAYSMVDANVNNAD